MTTTTASGKPRLWVPGDWNAFFGFGTNILVNLLVLTGLLRSSASAPTSSSTCWCSPACCASC